MKHLWIWQIAMLLAIFGLWQLATDPELIPPFVWADNASRAAFFFGEPKKIFMVIWEWFSGGTIYRHLWVTLQETALAFVIGASLGLAIGLWLGLSPVASALFDPYITAFNAMPRVVLAPIFMVWFGLGIWSKVALGVTLVFFIVFFNVYQGVKEVSPVVLNNAVMLGANRKQLLRHVYLPSATSWLFSSLHTSVGMAFVGAVVGEYLGSASGVGYLIQQAEGAFDINTVFAGILVLTAFALVVDFVVGRVERRLLSGGRDAAGPSSFEEADMSADHSHDWKHHGVRVVHAHELDPNVPQTQGMSRAAAINFAQTGAEKIWAGTVKIHPNAKTGAHHHGPVESVIYVVKGKARMRWGERLEYTAEAGPGDFIWVPPFVPHQEINASEDEPLECVLLRSGQEPVVVNLDIPVVEKPEEVFWVDNIHPHPEKGC